MIVGEIEENDDKVRSVYGGSVEQAACRNLARSCAPKPGRVPKPGRRSHAEARPARVRRSLAAGRVPKPGRAPVTARRGPALRGPARAGGGRETGKTDSTTVEITCACSRITVRARRFANFWKQIEKNDQVLSVYGGSVLRIEKNGKVRRAGRSYRACVAHGE